MADTGLERIIAAEFARVGASGSGGDLREALVETSRQLDGVRAVSQSLTDALGVNTQAVASNTASGLKGVAADAGRSALNTLGSLTLAPVFSSLFKLFGGGGKAEPAPLVKYSAPAPARIEAAYLASEQRIAAADSGQDGRTRALPAAAPAQITVQVQALDSRSFLDRSGEIAQAVRDAMLNSHAINDVVSDL